MKKTISSPATHSDRPAKREKDEDMVRGRSKSEGDAIPKGMYTSHLMELFVDQLKDILWAEKALTKAIPKMITFATSDDLMEALKNHLKQTEKQVERLTGVFKSIDKKPSTVKCKAMEGLIKEATDLMEDCEKGPKCDAAIITAAQKIEHYEIASYGTLRKFAETLGLREAEMLLKETLREEKEADQILTHVAVQGVNMDAASGQT